MLYLKLVRVNKIKLGWLFIILLYYGLVGTTIAIIPDSLTTGASSSSLTDDINISEVQGDIEEESWFSSFFDVLGSIGRFFGLLLFGVGLPTSTPSIITIIFATFQTIVTMLTAGLLISALQGN